MGKVTALGIALIVMCIALLGSQDWEAVGIYKGCSLLGRVVYPFFHANILHAALNAWALLSIVFLYGKTVWRLLLAYIVAITAPAFMTAPTVGLSAVVYCLYGSLSFEVIRKWYFQAWLLFYLTIGFFFPNTNAWLHVYCYAVGLLGGFLCKPIRVKEG